MNRMLIVVLLVAGCSSGKSDAKEKMKKVLPKIERRILKRGVLADCRKAGPFQHDDGEWSSRFICESDNTAVFGTFTAWSKDGKTLWRTEVD